MASEVLAVGATRARLATLIGIPLYTIFGGIGLWMATAVWNRLVCDDVLVPSVLGGTTAAIGATSAVAVVIGVAGVSSIAQRVQGGVSGASGRGILEGAGIGALAAVGPSVLIVTGCLHVLAGVAATLIGLVIPSALTGAVGVALLRPVAESPSLRRLLGLAKWLSVVLVALWAVLSFAPLDRWMLLACSVG
ncbi:hypothetical protein P0L94_17215 [Microbacter sp. GSS18]|nr:hypothetical protein P0L94_17215 [Microbacter sp. GSS18]